jgi:O-antigen/teichoic acid export membrane protein
LAYGAIGLAQRAVGFVLLPVYARVLTPTDYGQVALLLTVSAIAGSLFTFGLEAGILRIWYLLKGEEKERRRLMNTAWLFLAVVPLVLTGLLALLLWISGWSTPEVPNRLLTFDLIAVALSVAATTLPYTVFRAEGRFTSYVKVSAAYAIAQTGLKVILVIGLDYKVGGWVASDVLAGVLVIPVGLIVLRYRPDASFSVPHLRSSLAIGVPLLPHQLSHWALQFADRIVISALLTVSAVGVYSAGYQFGAILIALLAEVNRASIPEYGGFLAKEISGEDLASSITVQVTITCFLGLGLSLIGPVFLRMTLPTEYSGAAGVVPWAALGGVLVGLYYIPMNLIAIVAGDTRWVWMATFVAAAFNVLLNLATVSRWGLTAAAVNTAVSYGMLLGLVTIYQHRRVRTPIHLEWPRLARVASTCLVAYAAGAAGAADRALPVAFIARGAACAIAGLALMVGVGGWLPLRRAAVASSAESASTS